MTTEPLPALLEKLCREICYFAEDDFSDKTPEGESCATDRYRALFKLARDTLTELAQSAPSAPVEPVAWLMRTDRLEICRLEPDNRHRVDAFPVYAHPAAQEPTIKTEHWREPTTP